MSRAAFAGSMAGSGNGGLTGNGTSGGHINTCLLVISTDLVSNINTCLLVISTDLVGNINTCLLVQSKNHGRTKLTHQNRIG